MQQLSGDRNHVSLEAWIDRRMKGPDWRYRLIAKTPVFNRDVTKLTDRQRRRLRQRPIPRWASGKPHPCVSTRYVDVRGADSSARVRIDAPAEPKPASRPLVVYIHGGAWMFGDMDTPAWLTTRLANSTGAVVASIDYRLAPEHPFPAGLDDCWDALLWLAESASELGADPERIAVMGDSAGGNLAAAVCLMARDAEWPVIRHQTLIYPALDLTLGSPSFDTEGHHGVITRPQMVALRAMYIGKTDPANWRVSPLLADELDGLPPTHIVAAEHDTLRDDGFRYADRLRSAGVRVRLDNYAGMTHGFIALRVTPSMRRKALKDIVHELDTALVVQ